MAIFRVGVSGTEIDIPENGLVLDVGSGHSPCRRADVLVDMSIEDCSQRAGCPIDFGEKDFILADAQNLPFKDKVFEFVVASHVAEHVDNPGQLCRELSRVAKSGYVETPSRLTEILLGEPFHKWYVDLTRDSSGNEVLLFERKLDHLPLGGLIYRLFYGDGRENPSTLANRVKAAVQWRLALFIHSNPLARRIFRAVSLEVNNQELRELWTLRSDLTYTKYRWKNDMRFIVRDSEGRA